MISEDMGNHAIYDLNWNGFVDLGLPSRTLWATCNVGADSPEQTGLLFSWGVTRGTYRGDGIVGRLSNYQQKQINRIFHNTTMFVLPKPFDMASYNMGGDWTMPLSYDFKELQTYCNWHRNCIINGVRGTLVCSKKNSSKLFFPRQHYINDIGNLNDCQNGYYWCSDTDKYDSPFCAVVQFKDTFLQISTFGGHYGHMVRGVIRRQGKWSQPHLIRKGHCQFKIEELLNTRN